MINVRGILVTQALIPLVQKPLPSMSCDWWFFWSTKPLNPSNWQNKRMSAAVGSFFLSLWPFRVHNYVEGEETTVKQQKGKRNQAQGSGIANQQTRRFSSEEVPCPRRANSAKAPRSELNYCHGERDIHPAGDACWRQQGFDIQHDRNRMAEPSSKLPEQSRSEIHPRQWHHRRRSFSLASNSPWWNYDVEIMIQDSTCKDQFYTILSDQLRQPSNNQHQRPLSSLLRGKPEN